MFTKKNKLWNNPKSRKAQFRKGNIPWVKGKHHTEETKRKISKANKGNVSWMKGKTKENYKPLKKISEFMKKNNPMFNKITVLKANSNGKRNYKEQQKKAIKTNIQSGLYKKLSQIMKSGGALTARKGNRFKPNKPEKLMIELIKANKLPFNYVGDGKIWFKGTNHSFNPDFLSKNPKYIIEVFGDYWHNLPKIKKRDKERLKTYKKYGYKNLIIWENELKNPIQVINKIKEFINVNI